MRYKSILVYYCSRFNDSNFGGKGFTFFILHDQKVLIIMIMIMIIIIHKYVRENKH